MVAVLSRLGGLLLVAVSVTQCNTPTMHELPRLETCHRDYHMIGYTIPRVMIQFSQRGFYGDAMRKTTMCMFMHHVSTNPLEPGMELGLQSMSAHSACCISHLQI